MTGRSSVRLRALLSSAILLAASAQPGAGQSPAEAALVDAEAVGWGVGSEHAPVVVVEFSDLSCPYCATFHDGTRKALREEFVDGGRVRWVTLSYVSGQYRFSEAAALAAECAGLQGEYEAFSASMLAKRDDWVGGPSGAVEAVVRSVADALELDRTAWATCLESADVAQRLDTIRDMARQAGVRGTPTWFVDGFAVMGALPLGYARSFIVDRLEAGPVR